MSAQSPILQSQIATWRLHAAEGTITPEELKEAVRALRAGRESAAYSSEAAKRKRAVKEIPHADDLLSELGDL